MWVVNYISDLCLPSLWRIILRYGFILAFGKTHAYLWEKKMITAHSAHNLHSFAHKMLLSAVWHKPLEERQLDHTDVYEDSVLTLRYMCSEKTVPIFWRMNAGPSVGEFWVLSLIFKPAWWTCAGVAQGTLRTLRLSAAPCPSTRASAPTQGESHPTGGHQPFVVKTFKLLLLLPLNPNNP